MEGDKAGREGPRECGNERKIGKRRQNKVADKLSDEIGAGRGGRGKKKKEGGLKPMLH